MRKIDTIRFRVATRQTSREINRTIVLNLVRARQPVSRADLARAWGVRRGAVSLIVSDLLRDGAIVKGGTGDAIRRLRRPLLPERSFTFTCGATHERVRRHPRQ